MEYQVGSLADIISGTHDKTALKTKVVFVHKKRLSSLKISGTDDKLNVHNPLQSKKSGEYFPMKKRKVNISEEPPFSPKKQYISQSVNNIVHPHQEKVVERKKTKSVKQDIKNSNNAQVEPEKGNTFPNSKNTLNKSGSKKLKKSILPLTKSRMSTNKVNKHQTVEESHGHIGSNVLNNSLPIGKYITSPTYEGHSTKGNRNSQSDSGNHTSLNEEHESRTIFIKNLPYSADMKEIKAKFKKFGPIECARFRCAVGEDTRVKKKVVVIKKQFHPQRSNICAFIRYKNSESVEAALKAKKLVFKEHHLFIDRAMKSKKSQDQRKAIFVGNVPFDAEEDEIYKIFDQCGEITDIRIVRDSQTGFGKGFAYVNFASADGVELALTFNGTKLRDRELRVSRSNPMKNKSSAKPKGNKSQFKRNKRKNNYRIATNENNRADPSTRNTKTNFQFQGQKITDKKQKRKVNKEEMKKKIIAKKLLAKKNRKEIKSAG